MRTIESIINNTNNTNNAFILTYWRQEMPGLSENIEVYIDPAPEKTTGIPVPSDACVDEYIVISADYSDDLFKFRQNKAADGNNYWIYDDKYKLIIDNHQLIIIN
jgi:hypothetical protein